jgi:hypothetical protein
MKQMIKGGVYHLRWFVPRFIGNPAFDLAAHDRLPFWQLLYTRRSLSASATILYYIIVPFLVDRMPWFASKRLMNLVLNREVYTDFQWSDAVSKHLFELNNVTCLKS